MDKKELIEELNFCLDLWEKQGYCEFGMKRECKNCGAPYLLWKLITGEKIHEKNLDFHAWKEKVNYIKETRQD